MGTAMRAVSEDKGAAQLMGDQCEYHYFCYICHRFGAGSHRGCADAVGLSAADSHNRFHAWHQGIYCRGYWRPFGSDPRCVLGGILLGVIEIFSRAYISQEVADAIVFAVLIVVLLVKPTGLLGKQMSEKV